MTRDDALLLVLWAALVAPVLVAPVLVSLLR